VKHKTQSKRITRKLNELRRDAWRRMHESLADQHRWYVSVLRGHCAYYGMPHNWRALAGFRRELRRIWFLYLIYVGAANARAAGVGTGSTR